MTAASYDPRALWTCVCGQECRGNGGRTSHQARCETFTAHRMMECFDSADRCDDRYAAQVWRTLADRWRRMLARLVEERA